MFRVLINLTHKKVGFSVNFGRLALASALGEPTFEHAVFNIQIILSFSSLYTIINKDIAGMDKLKDKYGISIYKLVNIAIRNLLDDYHK